MSIDHVILEILQHTNEPSLNTTLDQLPIKPIITLQGNNLMLELACGFPSKLLSGGTQDALKLAIQEALPDYTASVRYTTKIKAHETQLPGKALRGVKNVIAVASGKGGVGKSTVAVNIASTLAKAGARVGILDADIYGPSIPLMMGTPPSVKVVNDKYQPVMVHGVQAMSIGYLTKDEPALIWRGPMLAKSLIQMLDITLWDELDYLLIDLPPGTGDIQLSLVQKIPLAGAVIVTTPQSVATLDAEKAIKMFNKTNIKVLGIVENMSTHVCSNCNHEETIFGAGGAQSISDTFQVPLLGQLPLSQQISKDGDSGNPTALSRAIEADSFAVATTNMAVELAKNKLNYAGKIPPVSVEPS
jgi:ATP-binding protein involved in chromosome partitioning